MEGHSMVVAQQLSKPGPAIKTDREFTGFFQRLPPLDVLDTLGFRLLSVGFPLLSIGVVSGALWAVRIDPGAPPITIAQTFDLLA